MDLEKFVQGLVDIVHDLSEEQQRQMKAVLQVGLTDPYGGIKAVSVEGLMSNIMSTVAGLTNDQQAAIHSALTVGLEEEEDHMAYDAEEEDELVDEIMAELEDEELLAELDDEELMAELDEDEELMAWQAEEDEDEELMAWLAEEDEDEELMAWLAEEDEDEELMAWLAEEDEDEVMTEEELEDTIRTAVRSAFRRYGRSEPRRRRRIRRPYHRARKSLNIATRRPPYSFSYASGGRGGNAVKVINQLRFGETSSAVKAIAFDLYGGNYDEQRYNQHQAFATYVRRGKDALKTAEQAVLRKIILTPQQIEFLAQNGVSVKSVKTDMSEVLLDLGGFLVPEDFRTDMIQRLPGLTVVRSRANVGPTGADVMTRVKVTGGDDRYTSAVRVTWVGDAPTATARTAPTFSVERTPIHIAKATIRIPVSLLEDTPFPLTQWINTEVSKAFAVDEDEQFLIGDGIAKPEGVLPDSANPNTRITEVVSGSAAALTADGIINMVYGLPQQYWEGAVWVMNRTTAGVIRKFKDGEGRYLWEDSYQAGQPPTLLGYPVAMSEAMPDVAANAYPILFGNFSEGYSIADRVGMSVIRDDITEAESDLIRFLFRRRLGGQIVGEWAFTAQKVSA